MEEAKRGRRRYEAQFKRQVLTECEQPGASVAGVALSHGINANLVHKWRRQACSGDRAARHLSETFVPIRLAAPTSAAPSAAIHVEVRRGPVSVRIDWPLSAAAECAGWLRHWLA